MCLQYSVSVFMEVNVFAVVQYSVSVFMEVNVFAVVQHSVSVFHVGEYICSGAVFRECVHGEETGSWHRCGRVPGDIRGAGRHRRETLEGVKD